jgi:hypothetical protein
VRVACEGTGEGNGGAGGEGEQVNAAGGGNEGEGGGVGRKHGAGVGGRRGIQFLDTEAAVLGGGPQQREKSSEYGDRDKAGDDEQRAGVPGQRGAPISFAGCGKR